MTDTPEIASSLTPLQQARRAAMAICAEATREELETVVAAVGYPGAVAILRRPETGLVLVRGRAGGDGDAFNLGEMTLTRCVVRLDDGVEGYAWTPGRDGARTRAAAIIDALVQSPTHASDLDAAMTPVRQRLADDLAVAESRTAATRVNFFTMVRGED
ncbi:protein phnG [Camelimonas fluminis]|uniref:Phosphonate C-P lyase system protein PhnG n=1 Tax=Camelimonas fluminis TaxID=1576911 RepID=A0ABV7UL66_9HYPH|nr:phosphonate C-P lyase system protein PhnG [Camelimonas fluminis]GHE60794.1 protein phnG [Camelimonas fluminis]